MSQSKTFLILKATFEQLKYIIKPYTIHIEKGEHVEVTIVKPDMHNQVNTLMEIFCKRGVAETKTDSK